MNILSISSKYTRGMQVFTIEFDQVIDEDNLPIDVITNAIANEKGFENQDPTTWSLHQAVEGHEMMDEWVVSPCPTYNEEATEMEFELDIAETYDY